MTATTTDTKPPLPTGGTTSTTFPTDTGFGGIDDPSPDHWLHIDELGDWNLGPAGGPYDSLSGSFTLMEIVDELDTEEGPDCLVTWTLDGAPPGMLGTCAGCDPSFEVRFTLATGDRGTCQSPDLPPADENQAWRMAWHPGEQAIYRNMGGTTIWVRWWDNAAKVGDTISFMFVASYPIFVEEEM